MPKKLEFDIVKKIFTDANCILISKEYESKKKLIYICSCGNQSSIRLDHFRNGHRCRQCASQKIIKSKIHSYDYVYNYFLEKGCPLISKTYKGCQEKLDYICKCGRPSKIAFDNFQIGQRCYQCMIDKFKLERLGENNPAWNPNLNDEDRTRIRRCKGYGKCRLNAFKRDNYKCQICSSKDDIILHHLNAYHWHKEGRADINNVITLCRNCHDCEITGSFHNIYGNHNNTKQQFIEFLKIKNIDIPSFILDNGSNQFVTDCPQLPNAIKQPLVLVA